MTQDKSSPPKTTADAYLGALSAHGIDYLFGNAGTDFPAIIEGFARAQINASPVPKPITVPHENVAVSMAYGYYLGTGRPQAVMLHVNVGTANGICALMNAARDNIPMLFTSGRTPITEQGLDGSRSVQIHWAQEMFDQAGMVREMVKWDYELRLPEQVEHVVDRAISITKSAPMGPVYLSLPREVLAMPAANNIAAKATSAAATPPAPAKHALQEAATMIANAKAPVIIASSYGHTENAVVKLGVLAESWALPIVNFRPRRIALPTDHPMHAGFESAPFIKDADVIIVLEADVPWIPSLHKVNADAKIIHIGSDPLFANYPMRSFPCDLALTADGELAIEALIDELGAPEGDALKQIEARRKTIAARKAEQLEARKAAEAKLEDFGTINADFLAKCLNAQKGDDAVILSETQVPLRLFDFTKAGCFFSVSPAGGLGWGLGAALGLKLAKPEARVITLIGDGAYMFGNPTPAHFVASAYELPTLTIVANNRKWGAVRKATLGMYPDGAATRVNDVAFTNLEPSPEYHKVIEASGGYGEKVTDPKDLEPALKRAFKALDEGRPALLNVQVEYHDNQALAEAKK